MKFIQKHKIPLSIIRLGEYLITLLRMITKRSQQRAYSLDSQPFFIIGCGRSGNTLLRSMLCAGGNVVIPPESYVIPRVIRRFTAYNHLPWDVLASMVISEFEAFKEFYTWDVNLYSVHQKARNLNGKEKTLGNVIDLVYQEYAKKVGCEGTRWADKTPINSLYVAKIIKVFPDAKIIHLIRDPRATSLSYVKAGLEETLSDAAEFWCNANEAIEKVKKQNPEKFTMIKYEDLVKDPESILVQVCKHVGLPFSMKMLNHSESNKARDDTDAHKHHENSKKPLSTKYVNQWKNDLTAQELSVLDKILQNCSLFNVYKYKD